MSKKKKLNDLSELGGMVYSTNSGYEASDSEPESTPAPEDQQLEAHLEKKGRGGKTAVIIKGFEGTDAALKDLARALKNHCATGGSTKEREIIIQGNMRDKAMNFLREKGFAVKRVGG